MTNRVLQIVAALTVLGGFFQAVASAAEQRFTFQFPLRCELGVTCWIPNYVDLKPGKGLLDYACGTATYDASPGAQHKGTDFAVRDMAAVRQGVPVLAAASGQVIGMRDGMKDIAIAEANDLAVRNRECGNAVRIRHDNGLITQYCHMRQGSVLVRNGDRVSRGQKLGLVGLSGKTAFPHLHFQVERGNEIIDPFAGLGRRKACGAGENSLWDKATLAKLPYHPTAIYNAGFSSQKPDRKSIREGLYKDSYFRPTVPALVLWAEFFRLRAADEVVITITGPNGKKIHERRLPVTGDKAYYLAYSGLRAGQSGWPRGIYRGEVALIRDSETLSVTRRIEVR